MPEIWDERKKAQEEEYFRRKDQEALEKLRARRASENQAAGTTAAAMQCPRCDGTLVETGFEDVLIDRCDKCNGVWLDAGELERLREKEEGGWFSRMWGGKSEG